MNNTELLNNFSVIQKEAKKYSFRCEKILTNIGVLVKVDDVLVVPKETDVDELSSLLIFCARRRLHIYYARYEAKINFSNIPSDIYIKKDAMKSYYGFYENYKKWLECQLYAYLQFNSKDSAYVISTTVKKYLAAIDEEIALTDEERGMCRLASLLQAWGFNSPTKASSGYTMGKEESETGSLTDAQVFLHKIDPITYINKLKNAIKSNKFLFITANGSEQSYYDVREIVNIFCNEMGGDYDNMTQHFLDIYMKHITYTYPDETSVIKDVSNLLKPHLKSTNQITPASRVEKYIIDKGYKYVRIPTVLYTTYFIAEQKVRVTLFNFPKSDNALCYSPSKKKLTEFNRDFNSGIFNYYIYSDDDIESQLISLEKHFNLVQVYLSAKANLQAEKTDKNTQFFVETLTVLLLEVKTIYSQCYANYEKISKMDVFKVFDKEENLVNFIQDELAYYTK